MATIVYNIKHKRTFVDARPNGKPNFLNWNCNWPPESTEEMSFARKRWYTFEFGCIKKKQEKAFSILRNAAGVLMRSGRITITSKVYSAEAGDSNYLQYKCNRPGQSNRIPSRCHSSRHAQAPFAVHSHPKKAKIHQLFLTKAEENTKHEKKFSCTNNKL
ncbi:conserved hypothetical protein [Trichinella spiralis]|uniref:hypothetical protein n=1 Tax=Trichinella spiralis TaxID=6334 RepID=UPI0001EFE59E|nr:conserved hypothetical protein [Trichinella spiralis]